MAPSQTTVSALDHDVHHKDSLTPSVYLQCDIPQDSSSSFVRGVVTTILNDSIFQTSNPFRHAVAMIKEIKKMAKIPSILLKFSDGGTDQRNTLESVKCSSICIFKELNLDLLVAARCAPGQRWTNPAERVMSILNIGLQNCALERAAGDETIEQTIGKCSSMDDIRKLSATTCDLRDAWLASVAPCISAIQGRFTRLSLKDKAIQVCSPV